MYCTYSTLHRQSELGIKPLLTSSQKQLAATALYCTVRYIQYSTCHVQYVVRSVLYRTVMYEAAKVVAK